MHEDVVVSKGNIAEYLCLMESELRGRECKGEGREQQEDKMHQEY
jgi:hypothetical protein